MTALDRDALYAACRAIYDWAGTNFVLPPLTRGAAGSPAERKHEVTVAADCTLSFAVSLDPVFADRNIWPHAQLPLSFDIWLCSPGGHADELASEHRHELIGAFLLGAKLPMSMEANAGGVQRLLVQLASTYVFDCGDLTDLIETSEYEDICNRVSETLQSLTAPFFATVESGRAVWQIRARQDLFGDPRPPAVVFWPYPELPQANINPFLQAPPARRTRSFAVPAALAASLLLALLATATLIGDSSQRNKREELSASALPVRIAVTMPAIERTAMPEPAPAGFKNPEADRRESEIRPAALVREAQPEPTPAKEAQVFAPVQALPALVAMANAPALSSAAPTEASRPSTKASARAKPVSKSQKPVKLGAKLEPKNQFVNPLPGARKAVTTLVQGIERIPTRIATLVKQHTAH